MWRLALSLLLVGWVVPVPSLAECTKTIVNREIPGGEELPAHVVECDDEVAAPDPFESCDGLPGGLADACREAIEKRARAMALAQATAAIREGASDAEVVERFGLLPDEAAELRQSVEGGQS